MILGFTINEWAGIATIVGSTITAVYRYIVKPLLNRFDKLATSIDELSNNSKAEHRAIWARINHQRTELKQHDYEIGAIYRREGIEREEQHYED